MKSEKRAQLAALQCEYRKKHKEWKALRNSRNRDAWEQVRREASDLYHRASALHLEIVTEEIAADAASVSVQEFLEATHVHQPQHTAKKLKELRVVTVADILARWEEIKNISKSHLDRRLMPNAWESVEYSLGNVGYEFVTTIVLRRKQ